MIAARIIKNYEATSMDVSVTSVKEGGEERKVAVVSCLTRDQENVCIFMSLELLERMQRQASSALKE